MARHLTPLLRMREAASDAGIGPALRAVLAQLGEAGGVADRAALDGAIAGLGKDERHRLRRGGVTIGVLDVFHAALLKPGAAHWRLALLAARCDGAMPPLPTAGAVLLRLDDGAARAGARTAGFRDFAGALLRIDIAEQLARAAHDAIGRGVAFTPAEPQIVSVGIDEAAFCALMKAAGFRAIPPRQEGGVNWRFGGRPQRAQPRPAKTARISGVQPAPQPAPIRPRPGNAFAGLAGMMGL